MSSNLVCNHTCCHSYDYRPNWMTQSPITITNHYHNHNHNNNNNNNNNK